MKKENPRKDNDETKPEWSPEPAEDVETEGRIAEGTKRMSRIEISGSKGRIGANSRRKLTVKKGSLGETAKDGRTLGETSRDPNGPGEPRKRKTEEFSVSNEG